MPRVPGALRRRRRVREQGVPLHRDGAARGRRGLDLDVATGGELHVALHAGFPPERIVFHGNNKSAAELRSRDVAPASAGSWSTPSTSSTGSSRSRRRCGYAGQVLVRVTPGVEAHTHEFIETGTEDSKFGFGLQSGDALRGGEARRRRAASLRFGGSALPHRLAGVPARLVRGARSTTWSAWCARSRRETGATVDELNVGRRPRRALRRDRRRRRRSRSYADALQRGVREGARRARRALAPDARRSSPGVRSRRRRASRSTRSARSRRSPACAPTSRSTAG